MVMQEKKGLLMYWFQCLKQNLKKKKTCIPYAFVGGVLSQVTIYEACKNSLTNISGQFHSKYLFAFDIEMN